MNTNMIRGALYGCGFGLPLWAFVAAFFSVAGFVILLVAGMVCLICAVLIEDPDCGYNQTPQGLQQREFEAWEKEL